NASQPSERKPSGDPGPGVLRSGHSWGFVTVVFFIPRYTAGVFQVQAREEKQPGRDSSTQGDEESLSGTGQGEQLEERQRHSDEHAHAQGSEDRARLGQSEQTGRAERLHRLGAGLSSDTSTSTSCCEGLRQRQEQQRRNRRPRKLRRVRSEERRVG